MAIANFIEKGDIRHFFLGREPVWDGVYRASLDILRTRNSSSSDPTTSKLFAYEDFERPTDAPDVPPLRLLPNDLFCYFHSSGKSCSFSWNLVQVFPGTTALPKLISFAVRSFTRGLLVPWFGEQDLGGKVFSLQSIPMFHGMGVFILCVAVASFLCRSRHSLMCRQASCGASIGLLEPMGSFQMLNPQKFMAVTRAISADFVFSVPSILEVSGIFSL
jgi:hypothetical protein